MDMNEQLFEILIKGIIVSRGEDGATIAELRNDYAQLTLDTWPLADYTTFDIIKYLLSIDQVYYEKSESGAYIWYVRGVNMPMEMEKGTEMVTETSYKLPPPAPCNKAHAAVQQMDKILSDTLLIQSIEKSNQAKRAASSSKQEIEKKKSKMVQRTNAHNNVAPKNPGHDAVDSGNGQSTSSDKSSKNSFTNSSHEGYSNGATNGSSSSGNEEISNGHGSHSTMPAGFIQTDENNNNIYVPFEKHTEWVNEMSGYFKDQTTFVRKNWEALLTCEVTPTPSICSDAGKSSEAVMYDAELMGDNFFLHFAKIDLNCKLRNSLRPRQIGLCVSGQTLRAAASKLLYSPIQPVKKNLIINLGSIDILLGRNIIDIQGDFVHLIDVCERKGLEPILCTLPPLLSANFKPFDRAIIQTLLLFNRFITEDYGKYHTVDIWSCFTEKGKTLVDCYQPYTHDINMAGTKISFALWNRIGRQRTFHKIKEVLSKLN